MDISKSVILITGAAGFIASHVADYLLETYPELSLVVFDKLDYCANRKNVPASDRCIFVQGDILNLEFLKFVLVERKVDIIMHFAAMSHVDNSILAPIAHTETNCLGTQTLLEAGRFLGPQLKLFVHVSTDEVYGGEGGHLDESTRFNPTNPYSASKAAAECIVNAYFKTYRMPLIVTRANNIYGPRQFPEKVIPKFTYRLLRGMPCCLHGGGNTIRHFLFVRDVCRAFETILIKGEIGLSYNIGADQEFNMKEVAETILGKMRELKALPEKFETEEAIVTVDDRSFNDQRYFVKDDRLRSLGWAPTISFEEGMLETVKWYVENPNYWTAIEPYLEPHPQVFKQ